MTSEQVTELGQALEILSAKSSVIKERTELRKLIDENNKAESEVRIDDICAQYLSLTGALSAGWQTEPAR